MNERRPYVCEIGRFCRRPSVSRDVDIFLSRSSACSCENLDLLRQIGEWIEACRFRPAPHESSAG
jgi:hypothetical protein